MALVYLEISFISACVSDRTDAQSRYRREQSIQWMHECAHLHTLVISIEVISELSRPGFRLRDEAIKLVAEMGLLTINDDVKAVAERFVRERVMPGPVAGDAIHVAVAATNRVEFMLSWNVRHLANVNKVIHLERVCARLGLRPPRIVTPDVFMGSDDE